MSTATPKRFFIAAAPLFLVLFIDSMGLGLVFPILNTLIFSPDAHFVSDTFNENTRNLIYGLTISVFMFCWFFGAAFLGDLSDQIGRKKSLMICLVGAMIGYVFSAIGVLINSYIVLLIGRIVAGFTAGSQSIAQAAIVDISTPEHKARNLGMILFFTSLGFAFGPIVGGILSDHDLYHGFNFAMPFYFAAGISLLNAILLQLFFHETFSHIHQIKIKIYHAFEIFVSAFKHEKIRELSIIFLVMIFGWSSYYSFIPMYLLKLYHFSALRMGMFMGLMGVGFGIGTGFLVDQFTRRFSLKNCVIGSALLVSLLSLLTVMIPSEWTVWVFMFLLSMAMALACSTILTLFSNQVDADSQGWVMGITGAIMSFAFGINCLLMGLLAGVRPHLPILLTTISLALSAGLMKFIFNQK